MTYDNGFLTDHARQNIERIVDRLGQDHVIFTPPPPIHRAIYRSSSRFTGLPCPGCTLPGFLHALKLATERSIPLLVHGRTRAQMLKGFAPGSPDPFLSMLENAFHPYDEVKVRATTLSLARQLTRTLKVFVPQPSLKTGLRRLLLPDISRLRSLPDPPEIIGYFVYEPYDEESIKSTLEQAIDWRRTESDHLMGHDDCRVHPAAAYLHNQVYGYPILRPELGTMVREGDIARQAALNRLAQERCAVELDQESLSVLCEMTGFDAQRLIAHADRTRLAVRAIRKYLALRRTLLGSGEVPLFQGHSSD
jgi:hypothetical protein